MENKIHLSKIKKGRLRKPAIFIAVSVSSGLLDYSIYLALTHFSDYNANLAFTLSRLLSSVFNFSANWVFVFRHDGKRASLLPSLFKYYSLVLIVMLAGNGVISALKSSLGLGNLLSKFAADALTLSLSYLVQRKFVFSGKKS